MKFLLLCLVLASISPLPAEVTSKTFGRTKDGQPVTLYTLDNGPWLKVRVMDYGATLVNLFTQDENGQLDDVALGFRTLADYEATEKCFGATLGRYAGRIANGRFTLDGKTYQLALNDGKNTLHGGPRGFNRYVWKGEILDRAYPAVRFTRLSPDGEQGFPGNLRASVTYSLPTANELQITFEATTDRPTVVNLANHTYFNLSGSKSISILHHVLTLNADRVLETDRSLLPTGQLREVAKTPWDFRRPARIGARFNKLGNNPPGYNETYALNRSFLGWRFLWAARVFDPTSGRRMTIFTDQPALQLYTANFLGDELLPGKAGIPYPQHSGLCLETQQYPDAPNHPNFPSTVLRPGETYRSTTTYRFEFR